MMLFVAGKGKACSEIQRNETPEETSGCIVPANQGLDNKSVYRHCFNLLFHFKMLLIYFKTLLIY